MKHALTFSIAILFALLADLPAAEAAPIVGAIRCPRSAAAPKHKGGKPGRIASVESKSWS